MERSFCRIETNELLNIQSSQENQPFSPDQFCYSSKVGNIIHKDRKRIEPFGSTHKMEKQQKWLAFKTILMLWSPKEKTWRILSNLPNFLKAYACGGDQYIKMGKKVSDISRPIILASPQLSSLSEDQNSKHVNHTVY